MPRPKKDPPDQTESSLAPEPGTAPSTALATRPYCEMGLQIAQAELESLQDMSEHVAEQLLDGLADVRTMTVPELLTAIRVARSRLETLQTIVLQQAILA